MTQTIVQDMKLRRSMMHANGTLVQGVLQQIRRCDLPAGDAWAADIGGPDAASLSCTNTTVDPDPDHCQFSDFWSIPKNATGPRVDACAGGPCGRWDWWDAGERYAFWGTSTAPLRTAKLSVAEPSFHRWAIDFVGFVGGAPPLEAFDAVAGSDCPPASPGAAAGARSGLLGLIAAADARARRSSAA